MNHERNIYIAIFISLFFRYAWELLPFGGGNFIFIPVYLSLFILLSYYFVKITNKIYRVCVVFLMINLAGIFISALEHKWGPPLIFIGALAFFIYPVHLLWKRKNLFGKTTFSWFLLFSGLIMVQTIMYIFISTSKMLSIGHFLSFPLILVGVQLLYKNSLQKELTLDERKLIGYTVVLNVLSLIGVTFKESFYTFI